MPTIRLGQSVRTLYYVRVNSNGKLRAYCELLEKRVKVRKRELGSIPMRESNYRGEAGREY